MITALHGVKLVDERVVDLIQIACLKDSLDKLK